jgi:hypothetical protein
MQMIDIQRDLAVSLFGGEDGHEKHLLDPYCLFALGN